MNKLISILAWIGLGLIISILEDYLALHHWILVSAGLALIVFGCMKSEKEKESDTEVKDSNP